jgi:transcriptional regulator with XRE-family HTH domain
MWGIGKKRSKLGKWLDRNGLTQSWLAKESKVNRNTINALSSGSSAQEPQQRTLDKVMKAIKKVDPDARPSDFFDV